ncbi:PfkB family carbohydrate kinase [Nannocystis pusilla]|uniref:PfkB family carbohydrate kinase n=1 Tax=Nannocystis pusilla TaxID=889268 RepID=UPI003B80EFB0
MARRLGVKACLLGHVGDDDFGEEVLRGPRDVGVDVSPVVKVAGQATALSMIVLRGDGDKTILLAANANDAWGEGDIEAAVKIVETAPAGSVLTVDLEVPVAVVRAAVRAAQARGSRSCSIHRRPSACPTTSTR